MERVEEAGQELCFGEKIMDTIQSPGKSHSLSETIGSFIDSAVTQAVSCPFSRSLEDAV